MSKQQRLGAGREFDLIRRFLELPDHDELALGVGDDCAVLRDGTVISTDASVEGVHFRREWLSMPEIGYRAAAAALSDLAAVAAQPTALVVALQLRDQDYGEPAVEVMRGVAAAARAAGCAVAGGDTTRADTLALTVTVLGKATRPILRSGARAGESVFVTGRLGGAARAVRAWLAGDAPDPPARAAFAAPAPRIREALWLAERLALGAMIDISDGLLRDAGHIAAASSVRIELDTDALPAAAQTSLQDAAGGGDDYELCFTANAADLDSMRAQFEAHFKLPISRVGRVVAGTGAVLLDRAGHEIQIDAGYDHFQIR